MRAGAVTQLNRCILVCRLTLHWYHKTLLSELKSLEALLMRASTSAVTAVITNGVAKVLKGGHYIPRLGPNCGAV